MSVETNVNRLEVGIYLLDLIYSQREKGQKIVIYASLPTVNLSCTFFQSGVGTLIIISACITKFNLISDILQNVLPMQIHHSRVKNNI